MITLNNTQKHACER